MKKIILLICILVSTGIASAQQHEISIGYGYPTSLKIGNEVGDTFTGALVGSDLDNKFTGSFNLEYMYNFSSKMATGIILSYEHSKIKSIDYKENFVSIMPAFKMNWVQKNIFRFYSKVALGITLDVVSAGKSDETDVDFAYQVSPLGLEIGKCICGYAEVGYGHQGIGVIGIRYRF